MKLKGTLTVALTLTFHAALAGPTLWAAQAALPEGGDGLDVQEQATEPQDEWEALDAELRDLDQLEVEAPPGPDIWGYGRVNFFKEDVGNLAAVNLDNIRLNLTGQSFGARYRVTTDFASGTAILQDAWMSTSLGKELSVTLGQFKIPVLRSGLVEARDLLFIGRTRNGVFYSRRDQGVMLNGDHGRLHWAFATQNGANGVKQSGLITGRVNVNLIGPPPLPWEGALEAGSKPRLTLGAGISDDNSGAGGGKGVASAVELYGTYDRLSLQAEWVHFGRDYTIPDPAEQRGNTSPYSVTVSYMIVPERYELAVRFEDFNDVQTPLDLDRRAVTVGLNRYIQGHNIKWQLNYVEAFKGGVSDGPNDSLVGLGLTASF